MIIRHSAKYRGIAQLVEQRSPKPRAEGSNPSAPAKVLLATAGKAFLFAAIAQQVEHILGKDEVVRSSRISSSKISKTSVFEIFLF